MMKVFPVRKVNAESVSEAAMAVARHQAEQFTLVRRRAQPSAVYVTRLTLTAVFAYLLSLQLPGGSPRDVLAPLAALLVAQATLYHTIRAAIQRVVGVTAGVLAAAAVAAYVPFSWWVLGLLIAGALWLGIVLHLREDTLEVPISAMLIFSVDTHAYATTRITETLVGAAAGLAAGLIFAPLRVQPAKEAIGDLTRQMSDLLGRMADGLSLADPPDPRRAAEWLDKTRALRGEIQRVDDALSQAEESTRLNPKRLGIGNPAAGLRDSLDTLERAATDMRVLARSVVDSTWLDSEHSPVKEDETRARLAAMLAELSGAVRAYGQVIEADPVAPGSLSQPGETPAVAALEDHLEEAQRQQDKLADLLQTDPAEAPEGWPLRGEILAHVDRLRSELEPKNLPPQAQARVARSRLRALRRGIRHAREAAARQDRNRGGGPKSARRTMGSAFSRSAHRHSAHQVAPASASGATRSAAAAGSAGLAPDRTRSNGSPASPASARQS